MFDLIFTQPADADYQKLKDNPSKSGVLKQVQKTLGYLQTNPRHPSLQTHPYESIAHPFDLKEKVFEAYAQNQTPGAYRIFWCYGPNKKQITIVGITPHP